MVGCNSHLSVSHTFIYFWLPQMEFSIFGTTNLHSPCALRTWCTSRTCPLHFLYPCLLPLAVFCLFFFTTVSLVFNRLQTGFSELSLKRAAAVYTLPCCDHNRTRSWDVCWQCCSECTAPSYMLWWRTKKPVKGFFKSKPCELSDAVACWQCLLKC